MAVADLRRAHAERPIPSPPTSASPSPDGPPPSSRTRDTRTTATIARAIPTRTSGGGRPSRTIPAVTGMSAARTPVTGATTPIRPTASPRYSAVMPIAAGDAGQHAPAEVGGGGAVSPRTSARTSASAMPDELRHEHDAEQRRSAGSAGRRRSRRRPRRAPRAGRGRPSRLGAEPSSFRRAPALAAAAADRRRAVGRGVVGAVSTRSGRRARRPRRRRRRSGPTSSGR